jgi:hypothetical protein
MTPPTDNEILIALLDIRAKIANLRKQEGKEPWNICATQRHKAMDAAARFVDPKYAAEEEPTS